MSITKLGPQHYRIRVMVAGLRGDETMHGTRAEAVSRENAMRRELRAKADEKPCPTISGFWGDFMASCDRKGLAPSTVEGYAKDFANHVEPALGNVRLDKVTPAMVSELLGSKSAGTARHVRAVMSAMFSYAEELGFVDSNVMRRKYTMPSGVKRKANTGIYDMETMERIADACQGEPWEAMFLLMAFAGLRREEAAGVRCEDIGVHGGVVTVEVRRTVQIIAGEMVVGDGKTEDSRRTAVMVSHGSRLLELASGDGWLSEPDPNRLAKQYESWFKHQPFSYIPMKNLRASFSTAMTAAGMDAAMVSKLTGHVTLDVQYRHYLKPTVDDFIAALPDAFDGDLTGGRAGI